MANPQLSTLPSPTENRPWGAYQNIFSAQGGFASGGEARDFLVKLIEVAPGRRLSLQRHFKREEFWVIISGTGIFRLDAEEKTVRAGDMVRVGLKQVHRVTNDGATPLIILELQKGRCEESDIERIEDDYKR